MLRVPRSVRIAGPGASAACVLGLAVLIAAAGQSGLMRSAHAAPAAPASPSASDARTSKSPDDAPLSILPPSFIPLPLAPSRSDTGVGHVVPSESLEALAVLLAKTPDVVVADVAGTPITLGMVAEGVRSLPPMWGATPSRDVYDFVVAGLVQMRMLALKAKQTGLDKDPVVRLRIAMATDRELASAAMKAGTRDAVSAQALQQAYDQVYAGKPGPEEVWLRVIGAASKPEAEDALAQLNRGIPFPQAVQEFSKDPSRDAQGDLGYVTADTLPPELRSVAFALSVGGLSAYPLQSNGLWYILEVEGRRTRTAPPLTDVAGVLKDRLLFEAGRSFVVKTREETPVKVFGLTGVGTSSGQTAVGK